MVRKIEGDGKWRFITSLNPPLWVIHSVFAYMTASTLYMDCALAHSCTIQKESNLFTIVHITERMRVPHMIFYRYHLCQAVMLMLLTVFSQAHRCLCVIRKSTATDLLCPLNRLSVNLASSSSSFPFHYHSMPPGTLLPWPGFNFHLFTVSPRLCVPPTVTDAHKVRRHTHLDHSSHLHNSYAVQL